MVNVLGRDRLHDVAAIELKDIDLPPIPGRRDVEAKDGGEAVMTVGYSSDPPIGWPSTRVGILTTVSELPWLENLKAIETDASFDPVIREALSWTSMATSWALRRQPS